MNTLTLAQVWHGDLADIGHLDHQAAIPAVTTGPVAQGDLMICPSSFPARKVAARPESRWMDVPAEGIRIIDGRDNGGGHDHLLVARPGTARVTFDVDHPSRLGICLIETTEEATIQHVEHGAVLLPPGVYECRGQREQAAEERRVAD